MKSIIDYTSYCTGEQTTLAWKLGAPLLRHKVRNGNDLANPNKFTTLEDESITLVNPTTQEMIGWLRENLVLIGLTIFVPQTNQYSFEVNVYDRIAAEFIMFEECVDVKYNKAESKAISAGLSYLEKKKFYE